MYNKLLESQEEGRIVVVRDRKREFGRGGGGEGDP